MPRRWNGAGEPGVPEDEPGVVNSRTAPSGDFTSSSPAARPCYALLVVEAPRTCSGATRP